MFQAIALSLTAGVIWAAVGALFGKAPSERRQFIAFESLYAIVYCIAAFAVVKHVKPDFHELLKLGIVMIPCGLSDLAGFWLLKKVMTLGSQSIAWAVLQSALIMPFLFGLFLPGVKMSKLSMLGVAVLLGGLAFLGKEQQTTTARQMVGRRHYWLLLACAFLLVGTAQCLQLLPNYMSLSPETLSWRVCFEACLMLIVWNGLAFANKAYQWKSLWKMSMLYGIVVLAGQYVFFMAADAAAPCGWTAAVYPTSLGCCIAIFSIYCAIFRKEKLTLRGWTGILLVTLGVVGLAL